MLTFDNAVKLYGQWRSDGWNASAKIARNYGAKRFVETGCYRGIIGNGVSTVILAALASECSGILDSYDINQENVNIAKAELEKHGMNGAVRFHVRDSISGLAERTEPIDFAYLDSLDCDSGLESQEHQLGEIEAIFPVLSKSAVVLLDDHLEANGGKTKLSVPRLKASGFIDGLLSHQALFHSDDTTKRPKRKIGVLTGHLPNYANLARNTIYINRGLYCSRHGYDMVVVKSISKKYENLSSHAWGFSWSRLAKLLEMAESGTYEWIWCVGCDTLVTNFNVRLETFTEHAELPVGCLPRLIGKLPDAAPKHVIKNPHKASYVPDGKAHLVICSDRGSMVQADSFLIRCSTIGCSYLKDILNHYDIYKTHQWVEQQAMIDLRDKHGSITAILPQHCMNSFDYGIFWHLGPIYHTGKDCYGFRGQWQPGDFLIHWPSTSLEHRIQLANKFAKSIMR